ncbi:MAG TPA: acyl carrier protein [Candidatus Nocardiopsis merdipullorum]|nr:acyl carrier protein [Candidatus Nocardiopsis merdipullorum]
MQQELTPDLVLEHVAKALGVPTEEITHSESLLDQGMDSIRLMSLVERWRAHGIETDFATLAEEPTLQAWQKILTNHRPT